MAKRNAYGELYNPGYFQSKLLEYAQQGSLSKLRLLLNIPFCRPTLNSHLNFLAFQFALKGNHTDIVRYLGSIEDFQDYIKNYWYLTSPIIESVSRNFLEMTELLLQLGATTEAIFLSDKSPDEKFCPEPTSDVKDDFQLHTNRANTALHLALTTDMIDLLVSHGASVTALNQDRNTPLHLAARRGIVTQKMAAKAENINAQNIWGETALHQAANYAHYDSLSLLLRCPNIDINATDKWGNTALHVLLFSPHRVNLIPCLHLLLEAGIDAQRKNNHGVTAQELAQKRCNYGIVARLPEPIVMSSPSDLQLEIVPDNTQLDAVLDHSQITVKTEGSDSSSSHSNDFTPAFQHLQPAVRRSPRLVAKELIKQEKQEKEKEQVQEQEISKPRAQRRRDRRN